MKKIIAVFALLGMLSAALCALADVTPAETPAPDTGRKTAFEQVGQLVAPGTTAQSAALPTPAPEDGIQTQTGRLTFVSASRYRRTRKVSYYDNVYAVNHGDYLLQPFDSKVPEEYFVLDEDGTLALAPIVLDITDAMRERLYGADVGETAMFFGQYCEQIRDMRRLLKEVKTYTKYTDEKGNVHEVSKKSYIDARRKLAPNQVETGKTRYAASVYGYSGIHEGIDFVYEMGAPLHAILGGVVTRAGDSNGTVGIYSEDLDITLLYLHCGDIQVKRGDVVMASDVIGYEGGKGIRAGIYNNANYKAQGLHHVGGSHYVHVELRRGRHTSSNPYRNAILESDCPYEYMRQALNIEDSGRQPMTQAAVNQAQRMRAEAEARARAAALAAAATPEPTPEPVIEVVEESAAPGYGFGGEAEEPAEPAEEAGAEEAPEATLPPAGN